MIYIVLIVYLILTFGVSLIGVKSKNATPESYFLANRELNTLVLFFTILATNFSAFYFLGFAGEAYRIGYAFYVIMALGTALAGAMFFIVGPRIWLLGKEKAYMTPSELVYGETEDRALSSIFSLVMIVFTLPYLALQIIGGGYLLESLTQGEISYGLAVMLLTVFTIVYVIIGGMQSVAKTDLKQGLLLIVFMIMAVLIIAGELGGIKAANEASFLVKPELFSINGVDDVYTAQKWFSYLVFWMFCVPMFPQLFIRFYAAKNISVLKKSALYYALIPLIISLLPVMIGIWGHLSFPDLVGKEADQILPKMLLEHSNELFSALVMTGAIAAFMSTLDSQLLALSTMITRDFYMPFINKDISIKKEVFLGRCMVFLLAVIGLVIAWNPFDTIFDMGKMAFSGLAVLFPISAFILFNKYHHPGFSLLAIVLSVAGVFGFYYKLIPVSICFGFEPFIILILLSTLISGLGVLIKMSANKKGGS